MQPRGHTWDRPAALLLPPRGPCRDALTLEAGAGSAEPLWVASTWTEVTRITGLEHSVRGGCYRASCSVRAMISSWSSRDRSQK